MNLLSESLSPITQKMEKNAWKWGAVGEGGCWEGGWSITLGRSSVLISDNGLEPYQLEQERATKETECLQPPLRAIRRTV